MPALPSTPEGPQSLARHAGQEAMTPVAIIEACRTWLAATPERRMSVLSDLLSNLRGQPLAKGTIKRMELLLGSTGPAVAITAYSKKHGVRSPRLFDPEAALCLLALLAFNGIVRVNINNQKGPRTDKRGNFYLSVSLPGRPANNLSLLPAHRRCAGRPAGGTDWEGSRCLGPSQHAQGPPPREPPARQSESDSAGRPTTRGRMNTIDAAVKAVAEEHGKLTGLLRPLRKANAFWAQQ